MKAATMDQLRTSFDEIERWLSAGEAVELTKDGTAIACITPLAVMKETTTRPVWPDVAARARAYCGGKVLPEQEVAEIMALSRGERLL